MGPVSNIHDKIIWWRRMISRYRFTLEIALVLYLVLSFFPPTSFWYELKSVETIDNTYELGDPVYLNVAREIKFPFTGTWNVEVQRQGASGKFTDYCEASKVIPKTYSPNAELYLKYDEAGNLLGTPLEWWAYGDYNRCEGDDLPVGAYKIETCHYIHLPIILNRKKCVISNSFRVVKRKNR